MSLDHYRPPLTGPLTPPAAAALPVAPPASAPASGTLVARPRVRRVDYEPRAEPTAPAAGCACLRPTAGPGSALPPVQPPPDLLTDPAVYAHCGRVLQIAVEVLNRRRPHTVLAPIAAPSVVRYLRATTPASGTLHLTSVRVCQPHPRAAEVSAVCRDLQWRHHALCARFDLTGADWTCRSLRVLSPWGLAPRQALNSVAS